jgi:salicylate hydroxylase
MLVAGGGIGGLATALACNRAGWRARVFERAPAFAEAGAGLQLGPNATRVLKSWGLSDALREVAFFPESISIHGTAGNGKTLARMPLGEDIRCRYGAPYATLHRADLHGLLLQAVESTGETTVHLGSEAQEVDMRADAVRLRHQRAGEASVESEGEALLIADGLWSRLRNQVDFQSGQPAPTGHFAWRTLIEMKKLPAGLRIASAGVNVWLGPRLHVVAYPVRRGEWLNLVMLAEGRPGVSSGSPQDWSAAATTGEVAQVLAGSNPALLALAEAAPSWRRWMLHDRPPLAGPHMLANGRVALLGDAGHPMLPYLAQGAAMALEDASALQQALAMDIEEVQLSLARYALHRWQRVARVQARARRQSHIFHATGPMRWGRDAALALMGRRLLDQPWLWGGMP